MYKNLYLEFQKSLSKNDLSYFKTLLKNVNSLPEDLMTPLIFSVCRVPERIPFFSSLIRFIDEVDYLEIYQGVALYSACEFQLEEDVAYLLSRGVRPNLCMERCLKSAIFYNENKTIENLLIKYGANKKLAIKYKQNPLNMIQIQDLSKENIYNN